MGASRKISVTLVWGVRGWRMEMEQKDKELCLSLFHKSPFLALAFHSQQMALQGWQSRAASCFPLQTCCLALMHTATEILHFKTGNVELSSN